MEQQKQTWRIATDRYLHNKTFVNSGNKKEYCYFILGSWRPIGHMRPSSPLLDSVRDQFEDYDQLAKDFTRVFLNSELNVAQNAQLFDVVFLVGQSKQKTKFIGVRAILGVRSR